MVPGTKHLVKFTKPVWHPRAFPAPARMCIAPRNLAIPVGKSPDLDTAIQQKQALIANLKNQDAALQKQIDTLQKQVKLLVEQKNEACKLQDTLTSAAFGGKLDILQALVGAGADVNAPNEDGLTPLHFAVMEGHIDCLNALVEAGADVDAHHKGGTTPLDIAMLEGNLECQLALVEAGAKRNALGKSGDSLKHAATGMEQYATIKLLLSGAKAEDEDEDGDKDEDIWNN